MLCPFKTGRAGGRGKSNKVTRVTAKKGIYICEKIFFENKKYPYMQEPKKLLPDVTFNEFCNFKEETMTEQQKWTEYERYKNYLRMQSLSDKEYEKKLKAKARELKI